MRLLKISGFFVFACSIVFFFSKAQLCHSEEPVSGTTGTITGRITTADGRPLARGQVLFYNASAGPPPSPEYARTPDAMDDIDDEGRFRTSLAPGKYYLQAVKRASGERRGRPRAGDLAFRSIDEQGRLKEYTIVSGKILDIGSRSQAVALKTQVLPGRVGTGIEGIVVDAAGAPAAGVVVLALTDVSARKPLFSSNRTGKDGSYILPLPPGIYFLRARAGFGGPPSPGELTGYYGETRPAPLALKEGQLQKGINLRVAPFPGRGPLSNGGQ